MPKGRFGLPRPFSSYKIIIDPHRKSVDLVKVGPFGGPRPFAKNNPPVEEGEVAECMLSEAGQKFGAGVVSNGATTDVEDLTPEGRQKALELAEKWCRGSMEAQAIEEMEEGEAIPALTRTRETLNNAVGSEDSVDIEMVGTRQEIEDEVIPTFQEA